MSATITFKRPLLDLWTVLSVTDLKSEHEVIAAIEDGRLRFAFNLATPDSKARLIRILASSVSEFLSGESAPAISEADDWRRAIKFIFPLPQQELCVSEVACRWNVSRTHLLNLCDGGLISLAKNAPRRPGPGGSPRLALSSLIEFLRKRRVL